MANEQDLKKTKMAFNALCEMLDEKDWHYDKNEEEFSINCGVKGEDLPIRIKITVDPERQLVILLSQLPFEVPEEKRIPMCVAVNVANYGLADGSFDYDVASGIIVFRMTSCYRESLIGKDLFEYMLMCACYTVDEYNDKFFVAAASDMSVETMLNVFE